MSQEYLNNFLKTVDILSNSSMITVGVGVLWDLRSRPLNVARDIAQLMLKVIGVAKEF